MKYARGLIVCFILLLSVGCGQNKMTNNEVVEAVDVCRDADLGFNILTNGWTQNTYSVICLDSRDI